MCPDATRLSGANGSSLPLADDLLRGADEIAAFIYGTPEDEKAQETNRRRVYHASSKRTLPTFYLNGAVCARKSSILKWIEQQEQAA